MQELGNFPLIASFIAGILTFISPCILPLIPLYVSFITGTSVEDLRGERAHPRHALITSLFFIAGFSLIFILLGASATWLGNLINTTKDYIRWIGGALIIIFGLHLAGVLRIPLLYREKTLPLGKVRGHLRPFLVGIVFAVGWTPCIGPILSSILILASAEETVARGIWLLAAYSLGLGIPFLLTALFIHWALRVFGSIKKYYRAIEILSGAVLVAVGILLITNSFRVITGYLGR